MILYHGSNMPVEKIDLLKSHKGKDFGRAFYLSFEETQAIEMAKFKVETFGGRVCVSKYEFDESILNNPAYKFLRFGRYSTIKRDILTLKLF